MSLFMMFRIALKALGRNKLRTALTMLGMIIGVAAVITMVALGTGAQAMIEEQVKATGTNMITVLAGQLQQRRRRAWAAAAPDALTPEDAEALRELPEFQCVAESVEHAPQIIDGNQTGTRRSRARTWTCRPSARGR